MRKHFILIFLSAFAILALMFFLWFWLLRGPAPTSENTGQLGEGAPRTGTTGTSGTSGNIQTPIGQNAGSGVQTPGATGGATGGVVGGGTQGTVPGGGTSFGGTNIPTSGTINGNFSNPPITYSTSYPTYVINVPGVVWIDGTYPPITIPSFPNTPIPLGPNVTFSAAPSTIAPGGTSTVTWSSSNATSCTASGGWSGTKTLTGSQVLTNIGSTSRSYTLSCGGPGGVTSQSITIIVTSTPLPPVPSTPGPTITLSANPTFLLSGRSATLTWSTTNATACTASGGWTGTKGTSGSQSITNITSSRVYSLSCSGPGGSVTRGVSITVTTVATSTPPTPVSGSGSPRRFSPTPINQISSATIAGTGYFENTPNGSAGENNLNGLWGLGIAGVVGCTPGLLGGVTVGGANTAANTAVNVAGAGIGVPVYAPATNAILTTSFGVSNSLQGSDTFRENFLDCIARTIARVAIQKITADIVDWINGGFEGEPAFVQDFDKFFAELADEAAGQFIQGSKLAFLCSPFQLQVKIAVAESYARRNGGGDGGESNSCTLTDVTNNIENFINGTFSDGGWPAFLEFTTVPTNNPFGAFMNAQVEIGNDIASAQAKATLDLSLGNGFLSSKDEEGNIVTPGSVIESQLEKTLNTSLDSLELADSFDEIIGALISQLMTRTLYGGLSNLSGSEGYASNFMSTQDAAAQETAQVLLTNLQGAVQFAQQYGSTRQKSITDVQNAQSLLQSLSNCWSVTASSSTLTPTQQGQALTNMQAANSSLLALETRVAAFNTDITKANAAIARVQQFQTSALSATTKSDADAVTAEFQSARSSGALFTQSDVTEAQQDRVTLQAEMASLNQTTNTQVTQCYAFGK